VEIAARPWTIIITLSYLSLVLAIGFWALRRTHSAVDFFIAGKRVGLVVTGFATMSAAFSGFVFMGGPGLTYKIGVASLFICIPVGITSGLLCWVVAKRLRMLAEVRDVLTVPDAVAVRFGSRPASGLAAVAVLSGTVGYLGAQMLALGVLVESIFGLERILGGWSLPVAMFAGMSVVMLYSTCGGMIAGVYTDLFQGVLMLVTAVAVFFYAMNAAGGPAGIVSSISSSPDFGAGFLEPLGTVPVMTALGFFFVFSIGTLGQPHMLHKFYMLNDPRKLKWMPLIIGFSQTVCILVWVGVGLAVPALVAQGGLQPLANPDGATPAFLMNIAPQFLAGLAFAGILAAIMSTADSFVNIGSAALVRDIPRAIGFRVRRELLWGRLATPCILIAATVFAYWYGDLIALLGTFAFGTFAAALAPVMAVGLNWKKVPASAACASIATGLILNLGMEFLARQTIFPSLPRPPLASGALPAVVALSASFGVLLVVSWWAGGSGEMPDADVEAVLDC